MTVYEEVKARVDDIPKYHISTHIAAIKDRSIDMFDEYLDLTNSEIRKRLQAVAVHTIAAIEAIDAAKGKEAGNAENIL